MKPDPLKNRRGERLDAAFHPGDRDDRLVVIGHGVTGNKDRPLLIAIAEGLAARGWPCMRLSFSGNGDSGGDFREATVTKESEDLRDVFAAIPDGTRVAYVGHSMGGAVGLMTAAASPRPEVLVTVAGMVFTGEFLEREFGDVTPDKGCMWDDEDCPLSRQFADDMESIGDLLDEAGAHRRPYLLVHGSIDDVVPPDESTRAHAAAAEPKRLVTVEGAGHLFEETGCDEVVEAIASWLETHLA